MASKKAAGKPARRVKDLPAKPLSSRQAKGVKGGAFKSIGTLKYNDVTLKRG